MKSLELSMLEAVLAATPDPPDAEAEPGEVLEAAQRIVVVRERHLDSLKARLGDSPVVGPECGPVLQEIRDKEARWNAALTRARHEMSQRLASVRRLRNAR